MNNIHPTMAPFLAAAKAIGQGKPLPRFTSTYCSQCGEEFGPGDHGYSHCSDHWEKPLPPARHFCKEVELIHLIAQINTFELTGEQAAQIAHALHGALVNSLYIEHGTVNFEANAELILKECKAFAADVEQQMHDDSKRVRTT